MTNRWKQAVKNLVPDSVWKQIRNTKKKSVQSVYRILARQLMSIEDEDRTGLTYYFEVQNYSAELVIQGYMQGLFPSAPGEEGQVTWHDPDIRGVLPLKDFHIPRNLRRILRQEKFKVCVNENFATVLEGCAEGRPKSHITSQYIDVYMKLHEQGIAHCVSAWQEDKLVGGTYGLAIGAYFASESAFYRVRDASKVATVRLTEILTEGGFAHHDTWWFSKDIEQFGGYSLSRDEFQKKHIQAILATAQFDPSVPCRRSRGEK